MAFATIKIWGHTLLPSGLNVTPTAAELQAAGFTSQSFQIWYGHPEIEYSIDTLDLINSEIKSYIAKRRLFTFKCENKYHNDTTVRDIATYYSDLSIFDKAYLYLDTNDYQFKITRTGNVQCCVPVELTSLTTEHKDEYGAKQIEFTLKGKKLL